MKLQIYGHFNNYFSLANVTRAWCRAIQREGIDFHVWAINQVLGPQYVDAPWDQGLSDAPVAIAFDYPTKAINLLRGHKVKILVTAFEADPIPTHWVDTCNELDLIIVPSEFCKEALDSCGVTTQVWVVPHGVHYTGRKTGKPRITCKEPILFHVCGSLSFPQRKGTIRLLRAMEALRDEPVWLTILSPKSAGMQAAIDSLDANGKVKLQDYPTGLSPVSMAAYIGCFDAVIQPSRGEGFGIVPLEARAIGVPAIMTSYSGHRQHFEPIVDVEVELEHEMESMPTQGNDVGLAPVLEADAVVEAIRHFLKYQQRYKQKAHEWALDYSFQWMWPVILEPVAREIRNMVREFGPVSMGVRTGLGG